VARLTRLLIANRGEIALRIARACREAGIDVVAVVTPQEPNPAHAQVADEVAVVDS
jgi:acetyl/propionyl-CoA carboxylase alpha subunit